MKTTQPALTREKNPGELVKKSLSMYGMRWMHVVRMGEPVDLNDWLNQVPFYSQELICTQRQHEMGVNVHHLRMWWPAREPVTLRNANLPEFDGQKALMWYLEDGQGVRDGACYAVLAYLEQFGAWPERVLIGKLPNGAPERFVAYEDQTDRVEVILQVVKWVPKQFIILDGGGAR